MFCDHFRSAQDVNFPKSPLHGHVLRSSCLVNFMERSQALSFANGNWYGFIQLRQDVAQGADCGQLSITGQVMAALHDPSVYECEADNLDLCSQVKEWKALERAYIDANPDDYVLMAPLAVQAFLPAWLVRAADDLAEANDARSALIFHVNASSVNLLYDSGWARSLAMFTYQQIDAVRELIRCTAEATWDEEDRQEARRALANSRAGFPNRAISSASRTDLTSAHSLRWATSRASRKLDLERGLTAG